MSIDKERIARRLSDHMEATSRDVGENTTFVDEVWGMVNVPEKYTALPNHIRVWISSGFESGHPEARVKVSNEYGVPPKKGVSQFSILICETPYELKGTSTLTGWEMKCVYAWLDINKQVLIDLWRSPDPDYRIAFGRIQPLPKKSANLLVEKAT